MELTLDLFLTGNIPKEEADELHVIIEKKPDEESKSSIFSGNQSRFIDTTPNQIQQQKKKQDLKKYLMEEYSDILGGAGDEKLKGNKYY